MPALLLHPRHSALPVVTVQVRVRVHEGGGGGSGDGLQPGCSEEKMKRRKRVDPFSFGLRCWYNITADTGLHFLRCHLWFTAADTPQCLVNSENGEQQHGGFSYGVFVCFLPTLGGCSSRLSCSSASSILYLLLLLRTLLLRLSGNKKTNQTSVGVEAVRVQNIIPRV